MAEQTEAHPPSPPPPNGKRFVLALTATGLIAGAAGAAVPLIVLRPADAPVVPHPASQRFEPLTPDRTAFVPFGEVTVNLNEGRLNRYLRLKIALQVDKEQAEYVTKVLEQKRLLLRNWLLSHLSDKDQEEIRGAAGQNMLRREIRDRFNEILFSDGYDRVYDVLFEEFNVQ